jgi:hypothetical protein
MTTLRGVPHSWISRNFRVTDDRTEVAHVDVAWLRESATFEVDGAPFQIRREGFLRPTFVLERGNVPVARATMGRILLPSFDIRTSDRHLTMRTTSPFVRKLTVFHGDRQIGSVTPRSPFSRVALLDLPDELSLPERVFLTHLAMVAWNRRRAAAAAGG